MLRDVRCCAGIPRLHEVPDGCPPHPSPPILRRIAGDTIRLEVPAGGSTRTPRAGSGVVRRPDRSSRARVARHANTGAGLGTAGAVCRSRLRHRGPRGERMFGSVIAPAVGKQVAFARFGACLYYTPLSHESFSVIKLIFDRFCSIGVYRTCPYCWVILQVGSREMTRQVPTNSHH